MCIDLSGEVSYYLLYKGFCSYKQLRCWNRLKYTGCKWMIWHHCKQGGRLISDQKLCSFDKTRSGENTCTCSALNSKPGNPSRSSYVIYFSCVVGQRGRGERSHCFKKHKLFVYSSWAVFNNNWHASICSGLALKLLLNVFGGFPPHFF